MNRCRLLACLAVCLGAPLASGKWAFRSKDVPVERLVRNIAAIIKKDPKNAEAHYVLGRIESLAFSSNSNVVQIVPASSDENLPSFAPYQTILVAGPKKEAFSASDVLHFRQSIEHYRSAVRLDSKNKLYRLGLGWMLELGAPRAHELIPGQTTESMRRAALAEYRAAYRLAAPAELSQTSFLRGGQRQTSLEAAEGILRILSKRKTTASENKEINELRRSIKSLKSIPVMITPIVIPLEGNGPLESLLAPAKTVQFDLAGDGVQRRWPWVNANAGILVWDPKGAGKITSGRQLFGSSTWWMLFDDGFQALRALDDNADGWLTGRELVGIGVWQDRNGNGISDRGEVLKAATRGIRGLRVRWSHRDGATLIARDGVKYIDGRTSPSFDWYPVAAPESDGKSLVHSR